LFVHHFEFLFLLLLKAQIFVSFRICAANAVVLIAARADINSARHFSFLLIHQQSQHRHQVVVARKGSKGVQQVLTATETACVTVQQVCRLELTTGGL